RRSARLLVEAERERSRVIPFFAGVDRRSIRIAWRPRPGVHRTHSLRSEQPKPGIEGCRKPSGPRLSPHISIADADDELLQQLRTVPISRETDSADDSQCAVRKALAGLRRRQERA